MAWIWKVLKTFIQFAVMIFVASIVIKMLPKIGDYFRESKQSIASVPMKKISVTPDSGFHLCDSLVGIDEILDTAIEMTYFLALSALDQKKQACPTYTLNTALTEVEVISEQPAPIPGYASLAVFTLNDAKLGVRYSALMEKSRTGLAEGAVNAIMQHRTESGINDAINSALSGQ